MMQAVLISAAGTAAEAGAEAVAWYADPTFYFLLAFLAFFALLGFLGVHRKITDALDSRSARIRDQLEEARTLREEGQALLAKYQRRQRDAKEEAEAIIKQAKDDSKIMMDQAEQDIAAMTKRREQLAEQKIAQMEANAVKAVRAAAATAAVNAARQVIADQMTGKDGARSIDDAIAGLEKKLH